MMSCPRLLSAFLLGLSANLAVADGVRWHSEARSGELRFSARYEGEQIPGRFSRFEVLLSTEDGTGEPRALTVEVVVASADMNDPEINEELTEPDWFDAGSYPLARFESHEIRRFGEGYLAAGRLQLRNIKQTVEVPFSWRHDGSHGTLSGSTELSRLAWGIGSGEWATDLRLADPVQVSYTVRLRRSE